MPSFTAGKIRGIHIGTLCAALVISCVCISGLEVDLFNKTLGESLFLIGMVGAWFMMLFTGVHGDFNAIGGIVYVLVNTVVFYGLMRFVVHLMNRSRTDR